MKIRGNKEGVALVEILVATVIIVFATVAIIQFYISSIWLSEINKDETVAMSHLINMAEAVKCTPFSNIPVDFPNGVSDGPGGSGYAALVGGYDLTSEHIVVSYANPGNDPLEIIINVTWQDRTGATRSKYLVTRRTG